MVEHIGAREIGVDMGGIDVTGDGREEVDVALRDGMGEAGGTADGEFVEGAVFEDAVGGGIRHVDDPSTA